MLNLTLLKKEYKKCHNSFKKRLIDKFKKVIILYGCVLLSSLMLSLIFINFDLKERGQGSGVGGKGVPPL